MATNMKSLNCEMFQITVRFDEKDFRKKEFKKEIGCKVKSHNSFSNFFESKDKKKQEHAHLDIRFDKKDSLFKVVFHNETIELDESVADNDESKEKVIYLEDVFDWFSEFFIKEDFAASITAAFGFDKNYQSLIKVQYPLLISNDLLQDTIITGHEIQFPKSSVVSRILLSSSGEELLMFLTGKSPIELKGFNVYSLMQKYAGYSHALVTKENNRNVKTEKKSVI